MIWLLACAYVFTFSTVATCPADSQKKVFDSVLSSSNQAAYKTKASVAVPTANSLTGHSLMCPKDRFKTVLRIQISDPAPRTLCGCGCRGRGEGGGEKEGDYWVGTEGTGMAPSARAARVTDAGWQSVLISWWCCPPSLASSVSSGHSTLTLGTRYTALQTHPVPRSTRQVK
ncbi:hypothetical protein BaRGS_00018571 [Batillaria attramentaria]|uniref:Secreted protein n=1 Tax=Batillaria attramentaria TaxID=370345 RepID=A0ABD0KSJ0_9CAEN